VAQVGVVQPTRRTTATIDVRSSVLAMAPGHHDDPVEDARGATEFFAPLVPGMLGCVFDHSSDDLVVGHIDVTDQLIAGTGFLFAPAVIALADTCAAIGCGNNVAEGHSFTTIELKANFLSSARAGDRVVCRCTPSHLGRQTHVWDAEVTNESTGRRIALFRCTQMVLAPRSAS
jgi:uncharacterized protein (TIGR00369 family)